MAEAKMVTLNTNGMMCTACEMLIEGALTGIKGISEVKADYAKEKTTIIYNPEVVELERIVEIVENAGYETSVA